MLEHAGVVKIFSPLLGNFVQLKQFFTNVIGVCFVNRYSLYANLTSDDSFSGLLFWLDLYLFVAARTSLRYASYAAKYG